MRKISMIIMVVVMDAADSATPNVVQSDLMSPTELEGLVHPQTAMGNQFVSAVGQLLQDVMSKLQPSLDRKLDEGIGAYNSGASSFINIDVSPSFKVKVQTDMANAFHDNNGAKTVSGDVQRTNGVNLNADFSSSLHDNNNAIGKNNVSRVNGVVSPEEESSSSIVEGALKGIGGSIIGGLVGEKGAPLPEGVNSQSLQFGEQISGKAWEVPTTDGASGAELLQHSAKSPSASFASLSCQPVSCNVCPAAKTECCNDFVAATSALCDQCVQSKGCEPKPVPTPSDLNAQSRTSEIAGNTLESNVKQGGGGGFLTIKVNPTFDFVVATNMSGSFYANNNAVSDSGAVSRVNGANVIANFSGALHDNNGAISKEGSVTRFNGVSNGMPK